MWIKNPSLELRHLPHSHVKGVPTPKIYIGKTAQNMGGCFYSPRKHPTAYLGETEVINKTGILFINEAVAEFAGSTITHEFMHLLQHIRGSISYWEPMSDKGTYKQQIIDYFSGSPAELGALLYQTKYSPVDHTLEWKEWVIDEYPSIFRVCK